MRHVAFGIFALMSGCTGRPLSPSTAGDAGSAIELSCRAAPQLLASDASELSYQFGVTGGRVYYPAESGGVVEGGSMKSIAVNGHDAKVLAPAHSQFISANEGNVFFGVQRNPAFGATPAQNNVFYQQWTDGEVRAVEGANADALFGTAAGANVGISFGKQALYRVDGAIGPSSLRSVPYPTGDAYESIGAAIVGRLAIYGTKSGEIIGYDLDDDSFSPLATAAAELLYIAGNEQEALIGSSSRSGPHPLTRLTADGTVTSAGSLPANDFLFVFDSDAIYSTNVQSGQLHATARYGNSNCSYVLPSPSVNSLAIDNDAVYAIITDDTPIDVDAGVFPATRVWRIAKDGHD